MGVAEGVLLTIEPPNSAAFGTEKKLVLVDEMVVLIVEKYRKVINLSITSCCVLVTVWEQVGEQGSALLGSSSSVRGCERV